MTAPMKRQLILSLAVMLLCTACGAGSLSPQPEQSFPSLTTQPPQPQPKDEPSAELQAPSGQETPKPPEDAPSSADHSVDLDLTALSSTMVYAQVFRIMMAPDDYIGKTIRISGLFTVYHDPQTHQVSCGVIVQDASACCAQGFRLALPQDFSPQDYPASQSKVTVVGEFEVDRSQEAEGILVLQLKDVIFESLG